MPSVLMFSYFYLKTKPTTVWVTYNQQMIPFHPCGVRQAHTSTPAYPVSAAFRATSCSSALDTVSSLCGGGKGKPRASCFEPLQRPITPCRKSLVTSLPPEAPASCYHCTEYEVSMWISERTQTVVLPGSPAVTQCCSMLYWPPAQETSVVL